MWSVWRYNSKGYLKDPHVQVHPQILFGPGVFLTPEFVEKHQITHVINCAQEEFSPTWFKQKYPDKYVCLNAIDSHDVEILLWYPKFCLKMNEFLKQGTVYVHCQAGINRSGFLTLMYLCSELNYPLEQTELRIIKTRPCSLTNVKFRNEIYSKLKIKQFILST
jgi:protein-tyrosine phosphatase